MEKMSEVFDRYKELDPEFRVLLEQHCKCDLYISSINDPISFDHYLKIYGFDFKYELVKYYTYYLAVEKWVYVTGGEDEF